MRYKEYTHEGRKRVPCSRCGRKPGFSSWQVCALGHTQHVLCKSCDIALNSLVLRWMKWPNHEQIAKAYRKDRIENY